MKLSVIVCTRNRAHAIGGCLDSIAAALAHATPLDAEIVVVDNGSSDDTSAVIRAWAKTCAFPVNLQYEPRKGLSVARNCAIRAAQGELIAWTDDDCRMAEDYVTALLRHDAADTELVLRGGRIELGDPTDLPLIIKSHREPSRWSRRLKSAKREPIGYCLMGCNMTMRRAVIDRLGPFDERFGAGGSIPGAEDTDYIYRAYLAGLTLAYDPDMVIFHYHGRKSNADGNTLFRGYFIAGGALYAKYFFKDPNLCRQLYWDIKNAFKEIIFRKNTFIPSIDFSHKEKVIYSFLGILKYMAVAAKGSASS